MVQLNRTLYGVRQAARERFRNLGMTLRDLGFEQSLVNPYFSKLMDGEEAEILVGIYVDGVR